MADVTKQPGKRSHFEGPRLRAIESKGDGPTSGRQWRSLYR